MRDYENGYSQALDGLTITPKRKTGRWIYPHETTTLVSICSECGAHGRGNLSFCPNCNADMNGTQRGIDGGD